MSERLWPTVLLFFLCACADTGFEQKSYRASAPLFFLHHDRPTQGDLLLEDEDEVYRPMGNLNLAEEADRRHGGDGYAEYVPSGCSLADRFDRDALVAYNFSDGRSRVALNLNTGDVGFGGVEVDQVMLRFRYKFESGVSSRSERCRYHSGFQGLIGSGYNELMLRKRNTVWDQMRDLNPMGMFN